MKEKLLENPALKISVGVIVGYLLALYRAPIWLFVVATFMTSLIFIILGW
jgi:hypothetical protein